MKHLSLLAALMLSSSMLYAGWTRYEFDPATGVYKTAPKYSCLEMICEHDCVENSETGEGECCSAGQFNDSCYAGLCCQDGLICSSQTAKGTCLCPSQTPKWNGNKCVECKTHTDCKGDKKWCLPEGICGCSSGSRAYVKPDKTEGCCNINQNKLITIAEGQVCCPNSKPKWNTKGKRCVQCLSDRDCGSGKECSSNTCINSYRFEPIFYNVEPQYIRH